MSLYFIENNSRGFVVTTSRAVAMNTARAMFAGGQMRGRSKPIFIERVVYQGTREVDYRAHVREGGRWIVAAPFVFNRHAIAEEFEVLRRMIDQQYRVLRAGGVA